MKYDVYFIQKVTSWTILTVFGKHFYNIAFPSIFIENGDNIALI